MIGFRILLVRKSTVIAKKFLGYGEEQDSSVLIGD